MTTDANNTNTESGRLADRSAIVTGSTSGIGAAIARTLADAGAHVIVSGRDRIRGTEGGERNPGGERTRRLSRGRSPRLLRAATRLRDCCDSNARGHVDILVNNAGIYPVTATEQLPDAELDAMLAVNIRAPHVLVGAIAPAMADRGHGAIITIGSWMAQVGSPFGAMYTATKAADEQLTRSWAAEYGPRGVRVNSLAPGVTVTPGDQAHRDMLDAMTATTPAGTVIRPRTSPRACSTSPPTMPQWSTAPRCTWTEDLHHPPQLNARPHGPCRRLTAPLSPLQLRPVGCCSRATSHRSRSWTGSGAA